MIQDVKDALIKAYDDFNDAKRMFEFAGDSTSIDISIELMSISNSKIKILKKILKEKEEWIDKSLEKKDWIKISI